MSDDDGSLAALAGFFALAFAIAWTGWFVAARIAEAGSLGMGVRALLFLPGTFAPAIAALTLTAWRGGREAVDRLLDGLFRWRVPLRYYVFALTFIAIAKLAAAATHRLVAGEWPVFGTTPVLLMLAGVAFSWPFQAGEEIGWRGFALPRMAKRMGVGTASLLLGVIWAAWHLPLFIMSGTDTTGQPFPVYLLSVVALSVALAWLFTRTAGSLLLVMIMHAAINNTAGIVPTAPATPVPLLDVGATPLAWLTCAMLWAMAAPLLVAMMRRDRKTPAPAAGVPAR